MTILFARVMDRTSVVGKRWIDEYFRRSQNEHLAQEEFQTKEAKSRTNPSGGHQ